MRKYFRWVSKTLSWFRCRVIQSIRMLLQKLVTTDKKMSVFIRNSLVETGTRLSSLAYTLGWEGLLRVLFITTSYAVASTVAIYLSMYTWMKYYPLLEGEHFIKRTVRFTLFSICLYYPAGRVIAHANSLRRYRQYSFWKHIIMPWKQLLMYYQFRWLYLVAFKGKSFQEALRR